MDNESKCMDQISLLPLKLYQISQQETHRVHQVAPLQAWSLCIHTSWVQNEAIQTVLIYLQMLQC